MSDQIKLLRRKFNHDLQVLEKYVKNEKGVGFTITDNIVDDLIAKSLKGNAYKIYRYYLRLWSSNPGTPAAWPSIPTICKTLGIGRKSVRRSNKLLEQKKLIKVERTQGKNNRYFQANLYEFLKENFKEDKEIQEFLKKHKKELTNTGIQIGNKKNKNKREEKREKKRNRTKAQERLLREVPYSQRKIMKRFINAYNKEYYEYYGELMFWTLKDFKLVRKNLDRLKRINNLEAIIKLFFNVRDSYISNLEKNIYLFFNENILRSLIAIYRKSDEGRWSVQAEKYFNQIKGLKIDYKNLDSWIRSKIRFPGAVSERDNFIFNKVKKKLINSYKAVYT